MHNKSLVDSKPFHWENDRWERGTEPGSNPLISVNISTVFLYSNKHILNRKTYLMKVSCFLCLVILFYLLKKISGAKYIYDLKNTGTLSAMDQNFVRNPWGQTNIPPLFFLLKWKLPPSRNYLQNLTYHYDLPLTYHLNYPEGPNNKTDRIFL